MATGKLVLLALGVRATLAGAGVLAACWPGLAPRRQFAGTVADGSLASVIPVHIAGHVLLWAFNLSDDADALGLVRSALFLRVLSALGRTAVFDLDSASPQRRVSGESGDGLLRPRTVGALGMDTVATQEVKGEYVGRRRGFSMVWTVGGAALVEDQHGTPIPLQLEELV